jgi:hypothetical protein
MHIRRTTAIVWLQTEGVGIGAIVGVDVVFENGAANLVDLLHVLMRPHIGRKSGGQSVECHALQAIRQACIAEDSNQHFERILILNHSTQLRSLRWVETGKMLIAAKDAIRLTVERIKHTDDLPDSIPFTRIARLPEPDAGRLDRHGVVDDMRRHIETKGATQRRISG